MTLLDAAPRHAHTAATLAARIVAIRQETADVVSLTLRGVAGHLPDWTPGAHVDLHLPDGAVRQYSLCGEAGRDWRLAVLRHEAGRGGSRAAHALRVGEVVAVSAPRNLFPMAPAPRYLFIAGGIGVTPILPMARAAQAMGAEWRALYLGHAAAQMAFAAELAALDPFRVELRQTALHGRPDLAALAATAAGAQVYACGPTGLLAALEAAFTAAGRFDALHVERFEAAPPVRPGDGSVRLHLARSARVVDVAPDQTFLAALHAAGVELPSSCEQGFCGTCECRVLAGRPDHRDTLLSDEERAAGKVMFPCVSRALDDALTLDL